MVKFSDTYILINDSLKNGPSEQAAKKNTDKFDLLIRQLNSVAQDLEFDFNDWQLHPNVRAAYYASKKSINYKLDLLEYGDDGHISKAKCPCQTVIQYLFVIRHKKRPNLFAFIGCNCIWHFKNKEIQLAVYKTVYNNKVYCIFCARAVADWTKIGYAPMHQKCKENKLFCLNIDYRQSAYDIIDNSFYDIKAIDLKDKTDLGYTYNKYKDSKFRFGKHLNKTYLEVLEADPKYIDWIITTENFYYKHVPAELTKFKDAYKQIKKMRAYIS